MDESLHIACVDAWWERASKDATPRQILAAFEDACGALWRRAHLTLGDVTLVAIAARVLHTTSEEIPWLAPITVDAAGFHVDHALRERASEMPIPELARGIHRVLTKLLAVVGHLTADVLSASLHEELANVALRSSGVEASKTPGPIPTDMKKVGQ